MKSGRSIRFKLLFWFTLVLTALTGITFLSIRAASNIVLQSTVREYLISTVEENVRQVRTAGSADGPEGYLYLPHSDGWLEIDIDFLETVHDVHAALYTADGTLLYGEALLPQLTEDIPFTETCLRRIEIDHVVYDLYDRAIHPDAAGDTASADAETLWIRGVVSEAAAASELREITQVSLALLPILIILAVFSAYLLISRLLAPLRKIENTTDLISRGDDLKTRIDAHDADYEVRHLAASFNRMLDRLEESFEAERQFTSDVSHELRNPTAVILTQTEYSLEKERSAAEYTEALNVIRKQGERMNLLIGDMLDLARMDRKTDRYPFENVDLSALAEEAAEQTLLTVANDIRIETEIESDVRVHGNPLLLSRMIQNLLGNACRYGRPGGKAVLHLAKTDEQIVLSISDDGIGINKEDLPRIFNRFYRGSTAQNMPGTGLGLAMVKTIAELHQAVVEVESEPGIGSTFRIIFSNTPNL